MHPAALLPRYDFKCVFCQPSKHNLPSPFNSTLALPVSWHGEHRATKLCAFLCGGFFLCLFVLLVTRFLPCLPSLALLTRHTALNSHLSLFIIFTYFVSVFAVKPRSYRLMTFTDVFVISLRSLFFKAFSSSLLSLTDSLQHMQPLASLSFSLSRTHTHTD